MDFNENLLETIYSHDYNYQIVNERFKHNNDLLVINFNIRSFN